ncbi:MAG: HD domain-containing protein [Acidobacteriota bacterium]|nr:HD domain-containing protein [Acidobacteriota bacterium]
MRTDYLPMMQLPSVSGIREDSSGWGFFLCAHKDVRTGRNGEFITLTLQDNTGQLTARLFDEVDRYKDEFSAGDFVKVQGRANLYQGRLQFIVERIRRVNPDQDRKEGFSEELCIPAAPRAIEEMWAELQGVIGRVQNPFVRELLQRMTTQNEARLRVWPAAVTVHHAYRGGFLEHILKIAEVGRLLAERYEANADLVVAGAILHDIGKLQELEYDTSARYSREGNLIGHITLGAMAVRDAARGISDFPPSLLTQVEHLIVSHHGSKEFGSPVEPMTIEAFILSMADDLDAKINQIRRAVRDDGSDSEFTGYHPRLGRVLWKGTEE